MDKQQWNEIKVRQRQWQKNQRRHARVENSKLYWIFDPRIHESHRIAPRATEQEYLRMRIRYFFSWEGLSKFLLAPVYTIHRTRLYRSERDVRFILWSYVPYTYGSLVSFRSIGCYRKDHL